MYLLEKRMFPPVCDAKHALLMFAGALFVLFFSFSRVSAQTLPSHFLKTVDSLIQKAPKTFMGIDAPLYTYRRDTVLMDYFNKACMKNNYLTGQSYALNQMGTKLRNISKYPRAIALHKFGLKKAEEANNIEFKIFSLNMLGVAYRRTDAIKTALDYNQEALELAESIESPSEGIKRSINVSLNSIGNIYKNLEQYELAISQFTRSLKLEGELGNKLGLAVNQGNIGNCQEELGMLNEALDSYRASMAYNEEIKSDMGLAICKNNIARVYVKQNMPREALALLKNTLETAEKLENSFITAPIYNNIGWAYMELGNYEAAKRNLFKGLELSEDSQMLRYSAGAHSLISDLYRLQGNFEQSLIHYKEAQNISSNIVNNRNLRYVNDMIIRYDAQKKNNEIEVLAKENEIVKLKLKKNRTTLLISGLALLLLTGILYILYRQYQLKNEKKVLTLEQSMLRSQMNPHFLFNSLNSIKLYIINNEKKNAVHYLNKFSKLIRKILEASSLKEIPLDEELETIELYMNIENIRFSNEIDFSILVDDDIDVHTIKIPSLILQPFLENALWHGLSPKVGKKKITLGVSRKKEGFITISITDNGVGREASEKIKASKVLKRKSVGIDITKERLANFSKDYQNSFKVHIVDLYDGANKPAGTQVVLEVPTI